MAKLNPELTINGARSPDNAKFGHFTSYFEGDGKEMYQEL